jgi:CDP-diacylglycerol--glycerol-3-phosphate 3-phosphatidyltransferase
MGLVMIVLAITLQLQIFKWLLPISFFTDLIDGTLARKYKVETVRGAKLDSISDDLTVAAAIIGMFLFKQDFALQQFNILLIILALFLVQTIYAFLTYRRATSFHTYLAKMAAILQGCFFILLFLLPEPVMFLFYATAFVTSLELIEEIIIIKFLKDWRTNVKGLYWVVRRKV